MGPALHRDLRLIALVAAGGAVGTLARHLLATAFEDDGGLPMTTLAINVAGAFLLGVLLEALVRRGADTDGSRRLRLGLGAGVLGGFTTFSALAVELERLLTDGDVALAGAYALASVVFGVAACGAGVLVGAQGHPTRVLPRAPETPGRVEVSDEPGADASWASRSGTTHTTRTPLDRGT